ncbi:L-arabinonate dehydratase [Maricaulis maris]|uniref:L-arabinonate dehydratase n=1 Tax=Maricaulis maris TaxID=74318 RepID=UPI003A8F5BAC
MTKTPEDLRSFRWFGDPGLRTFGHRSRMRQMGCDPEDWEGRPIIAIINTWSDINPCHAHFRQRAESVKTGILQSGGFPLELPAISLAEQFVKPSAMLYRNMLAMETEELIRSHPIDGVVLMGGCDKTTPGLLMGAISMDVPAIYLPAGPMLRGNWQGKTLGSGSDSWKYWDDLRAGEITRQDWEGVERGIARSYGHCMTMGTASTMTAIADALGTTLPGASSIPAADSNHIAMSKMAGRRIVDMVWTDLKPSDIIRPASVQNAIAVAMAMGCSTNAIIHLIAIGRRAGVDVTLEDFDRLSRVVPVIANVRPSGTDYLMEDFFYAGGLPALMTRLTDHLDLSMISVTGKPLGEDIANAQVYNDDVIRPVDNPIYAEGALAVLKGNLAPEGCVIKPSACSAKFQNHSGPALVFDDYADLKEQIDSDDLEVTEDSVLVLRNAGPVGGPGMPEWGMLPIPGKLVRAGVRDMLRLSDARMSGTSYGACVLHVSPEAHVGGPLALLKTGDMITVDIPGRRIHMEVSDEELARRRALWTPPEDPYQRGFGKMYMSHVSQAHDGCDFDFLQTAAGAPVPEPKIF